MNFIDTSIDKIKEVFGLSSSQEKKKEESFLYWDSPLIFQGKFINTGKIIGDYMLPLSPQNTKFHMSAENPEADLFYKRFGAFMEHEYGNAYAIEDIFSKEIEKHKNNFLELTDRKIEKKKELVFVFGDGELKNRKERGNICSYDYFKKGSKAGKIIMYIFNNDNLKPIDVIAVKKESELIRKDDDIKVDFGVLSRILKDKKKNPDGNWIAKVQQEGALFYPMIHFDINLYTTQQYLKELYYFFYYMTFSLFFRKSEEMKDYYKSIVIDVKNILGSLLNDVDIRTDIKGMIKNRDWFSLGQSLNGLIPGNFDVTYYYCFLSRDQKLYPCYLKVDSVKETKDKIFINIIPIWGNVGFSHKTILDIFKKTTSLEPKSFIYENLTSFNVKKDVNFMTYNQLDVIKDIVESYKILFNG